MIKYDSNLVGMLRLNGGIEQGLQFKSRYNFSIIFSNQKKIIKKKFFQKITENFKKINNKLEKAIVNS